MTINDVVTTRIGDTLKVEVIAQANTVRTLPNYGTVTKDRGDYAWSIVSGQSGRESNEAKAIDAAAQAIRDNWKRTLKHTHVGNQQVYVHVPGAIVVAINKVIEHYGEKMTKVFHAHDGETIVQYRTELGSGVGMIHFVHSGQPDGWVLALHTVPGHVEGGLPDRFNANVMYDTNADWWPTEQD